MVETTRVFECASCHAEILEVDRDAPVTTEGVSGEFAATRVHCPVCGATTKYNTGSDTSGDSPLSAVLPCEACGTVVEAFGVTESFVEHVRRHPERHDLHQRVATPTSERPG